jgi:hypothetical protein
METKTVQTGVICVQSRPLEALNLHGLATNWHHRAGDSERDALIAPDQETVLMISYCLRPDEVHCLTTIGIFTPNCGLAHEQHGDYTAAEALTSSEIFLDWVAQHASSGSIDSFALEIGFAKDSIERVRSVDYSFSFYWQKTTNEAGSHRGVMARISKESAAFSKRVQRAKFYEHFVDTLGLRNFVHVFLLGDSIKFLDKSPWHVDPLHTDLHSPCEPYYIRVFPFHEISSIRESAAKLLLAFPDKVSSMTFSVEWGMAAHNRLCGTFPAEYVGWQMNCFGAPSEALQAWFRGDLKARPPGRIPIGRGWEGDPNLGFAYSVSVVETPDGPCIELGSDNATHERLQMLSKYFEGLEFFPL